MGRLRVLFALMLAVPGAIAAQSQPVGPDPGIAPDIRDIRGPLPVDASPPFVLTGGVLLLAGGLLLIRRAIRRHRHAALPAPSPPPPRPDAIKLLAGLTAEYRQGVCPDDQLFIRLEELIRDTIAATTGIPAQRLTSSELRAEAAACLNVGERTLLDGLLPLCDRVKFAGYRPAAAEVDWALEVAAVGLLTPSRSGEVP